MSLETKLIIAFTLHITNQSIPLHYVFLYNEPNHILNYKNLQEVPFLTCDTNANTTLSCVVYEQMNELIH